MSTYQDVNSFYNKTKKFGFTKEQLFTLYILQEGISRRKYLKPSSGHGTIPFIKAFMALCEENDEKSDLSFFSGNTEIKCIKKFEPFFSEKAKINQLTLNSSKTFDDSPNKECLKTLDSKFPGTLLSLKIYLGENTLRKIINNGE